MSEVKWGGYKRLMIGWMGRPTAKRGLIRAKGRQ